jgi:tetratricopeptide (TPR) repeat protein
VAFTFANILRSEFRYVETISVLTPAIEALPSRRAADWPLYFSRGISFERTGQWERAVEDFRAALLLSPNQPDVLNYLGYTWVDRGENMVEAMEMINRALAMRPEAGYIIDSLGWGYYRLGDYEQAVTLLEQAIALDPGVSEINDHLGDALWRAGRYLEAIFHWNHALAYGPETEADAEIIRQKIANGLPAA